jgi:hypothetical protein
MASLVIDLTDEKDVAYGLSHLNRVAARFRARAATKRGASAGTMSEEELRAAIAGTLGTELRELMDTKTGRDLLVPFVERFGGKLPVTIEEIAKQINCEEGTDRMRKTHSLIAGLGRWEQPRGVKIFEPIAGKPQRYRMADAIWDVFNQELNDRADREDG